MMKRHILLAAVLAVVVALRCHAQQSDEPLRYVVAKITNHDKNTTNQVLSLAEFKKLSADIQAEAPLMGRALMAASVEWKKDDDHRGQAFPSMSLGSRQAAQVGETYASMELACAALKTELARQALLAPRRSQSDAGRAQSIEDAAEILADQLAGLKGEEAPGHAEAANKILLKPGQVLTRKTGGTTPLSYHIAVPDTFDQRKPPPLLVVFSPGGDGNGMMNQVKAAANKAGWMVIGCDQLRNGMNDNEEAALEKEVFQELHACIPYNQARLYYGGFSGGAMRSYLMSATYKDHCAGILAFGGWLGGEKYANARFQRNMAVAMVNGDSDSGASSWEAKDQATLKRRGCKVRVFHFTGGHAMPPAATVEQAISWMDDQTRVDGNPSKTPSAGTHGLAGKPDAS